MQLQPGTTKSGTAEVSVFAAGAYVTIFTALLLAIFSRNAGCLLYSLDGTSWVTAFQSQSLRSPFSEFGVDPFQGNFDAYYPAFREYFLPDALSLVFMGTSAGKVLTYTVYGALMMVATYCLARSVEVPRNVALLGGALFAAAALPTDLANLSWIYGIYNLLPHLAQVVALTIVIIACFWMAEASRPVVAVGFALIAVASTVVAVMSFVTMTVLMIPTIIIYGGASIFISSRRADVALRMAIAGVCAAVPILLGMVSYAYAVAGYTAYNFFSNEFMQSRASLSYASILYNPGWLGKSVVIIGLIGAVMAVASPSRKTKVFALTHITTTILFQIVTIAVVEFAEGYHGPSPLYFEFTMWPIMFLFVAFAASEAWRFAMDALPLSFYTVKWQTGLINRYGLLVAVPLFLASWNIAVAARGRTVNCSETGFFPIRKNAITEHLRQTIAAGENMPFRGLAATFDGAHDKRSVDWFDLHASDDRLWYKIGNDLRLVGLWWFGIPTLTQYSSLITPPYYLLLTDFLARPADQQVRSILVLSKPDERMLELWGVRFVIADYNPAIGQTVIKLPVPGQETERLIELTDPNLGDYSPTEIVRVDNFHEGLATMHEAGFDGRRTFVTEQRWKGPFVAAGDVRLVYRKSGFSLHASSPGRSVLVLPIQYSRCWSVSGTGDPVLFRANLMQLGVSFSGRLDAALAFRFGPLFASDCRIADIRDMDRLHIRDARAR